MAQTTITIRENGPYLVRGPVRLLDSDGVTYQLSGTAIALCRCGASTTKPFCDGTHSRIGFEAAERAVADERRSSRRPSGRAHAINPSTEGSEQS